MWPSFKSIATDLREALKNIEVSARGFSKQLKEPGAKQGSDKWEVIANSILAIRHLEDARMRYWKVLQYLWDWVSKFDK